MPDYGDTKGFQYQEEPDSPGSTGWTSLGGDDGNDKGWGGGNQGVTPETLANLQAQAQAAEQSYALGTGQVDPKLLSAAAAASGVPFGTGANIYPTATAESLGIPTAVPTTDGTGLEVIPKKIKTKVIDPIISGLGGFNLQDVLANMNMGKYATTLGQGLFGWTNTPTIKKLQDPNYAAVMLNLMRNAKGERNKRYSDYWNKWLYDEDANMTELGEEVYDEHGNLEEYLQAQVDRGEEVYGEGWSEGEILKQIDPEKYYDDNYPTTMGGLEDLAGLDAESNPDIAQMIFDARAELDRQQGDQGGGGGAGIMGAVPTPFTDVNNNGILDSLEVAQATTVPAATTPAAITTAAATTPTPFDYSQWPQFTSAYPGHYSNWGPNYINQGLGQGTQFDYWNQIANAFPGMRNYG